jgi:hypothetical protein
MQDNRKKKRTYQEGKTHDAGIQVLNPFPLKIRLLRRKEELLDIWEDLFLLHDIVFQEISWKRNVHGQTARTYSGLPLRGRGNRSFALP